jgi:hypothetical protein
VYWNKETQWDWRALQWSLTMHQGRAKRCNERKRSKSVKACIEHMQEWDWLCPACVVLCPAQALCLYGCIYLLFAKELQSQSRKAFFSFSPCTLYGQSLAQELWSQSRKFFFSFSPCMLYEQSLPGCHPRSSTFFLLENVEILYNRADYARRQW